MGLCKGRRQQGFTIIEVIIFLGVSAAILVVAQTVFSGQQTRTQFSQGVNDLVSTIQQAVDQVGIGIYPGQGKNTCSVSTTTGRPVLTSGAGSSSACIFLGNAFQVLAGHGDIYTYPVLGVRADSQGKVITDLAETNPEPIVNNGVGPLTTDYHFDWGTVVSSNVDWQNGDSDKSNLVGFYNNLVDGGVISGASGGQSIVAKGYKFTDDNPSSVNSTNLVKCLEEDPSGQCPSTNLINDWQLCLANSSDSSQTALVTFTSTPGGFSSNINFSPCP